MAEYIIHCDDVMRECAIVDEKRFKKLLASNKLPLVTSNKYKPIEKTTADNIVKTLTTKSVDWNKYKQKGSDSNIRYELAHSELISRVNKWYKSISIDKTAGNKVIGVVCRGGFLSGTTQNDEFVLSLDSKSNILIGDRGAGKSTILKLIELLNMTLYRDSSLFINDILNRFNNKSAEDHNVTNITKMLKAYSVDEYAIFTCSNNRVKCNYINIVKKIYNNLVHINNTWIDEGEPSLTTNLNIISLQQGAIQKIADDGNINYINNLIDEIYHDLYNARKDLLNEASSMIRQLQYYEFVYDESDSKANKQIDALDNNIKYLTDAWHNRNYTDEVTNIINKLIKSYEKEKEALPNGSIVSIRKNSKDPVSRLLLSTALCNELKRLLKDYINKEDEVEVYNDIDDTSFDQNAYNIPRISHKKNALRDIIYFLRDRRRFISSINDTFWEGSKIKHDASFKSLVDKYKVIYKSKLILLELQENTCKDIQRRLGNNLNIKTKKYDTITSQYKANIDELDAMMYYYNVLSNCTVADYSANSDHFINIRQKYVALIVNFKNNVHHDIKADKLFTDIIYDEIEIALRQGSIYRDFAHLSFGQKSGILLDLVLSLSDKDVIVIDQPEDNLDSNAIITMLAPTINKLKTTQIVLATHNPNLVMGLASSHIIVMESIGEFGRIRNCGSIDNNKIVEDVIDVLEGGVSPLESKLRVYDNFINKLYSGQKDKDIILIESSYRRKALDGLRNYLQPVISSKSVMDMIRHELKNKANGELHTQHINGSILQLPGENQLYEKLNTTVNALDKQISAIITKIDELKMFDTDANPTHFRVYELIEELLKEWNTKYQTLQIKYVGDREISMNADRAHCKLIFNNLIGNSSRSIASKIVKLKKFDMPQVITIKLNVDDRKTICFEYSDNGAGMSNETLKLIYNEPCSTQVGTDHGLGCLIIKKLLNINDADISVVNTGPEGTTHMIWFNIGAI